jgi:hypothetical protein
LSTRKIGYVLAAIGLTGALASILVDVLGFGDGGIQAAQILGILTGFMIAMFGLSLVLSVTEKHLDVRSSLRAGSERLLNLPASVWFLTGFLIVYFLFFLSPVFLNADRRIVYFNRFLPDRYPIGFDISYTLEHVKSWVTTGQSPYPQSIYPPLAYVLLSPLTLFDYPFSYTLSTCLTLFCYLVLTLLIPMLFNSTKDFSLVAFLSISGLFSYGFLFELERGQYYSIAFLLCMLAIYIFHRHYGWRFLAYVLFTFSVHLKIAPIFLMPMFIKDWRDWRGNLKRMAGLVLLNFALLFVLGYKNFMSFVEALSAQINTPAFLWNGNHSLSNFVFNFVKDGYGLFSEKTVLFLQQNADWLERSLLVIIAICLSSIIFYMARKGKSGFNPYLLLACTVCALVIPISVDYTLPVLAAPMAIFLGSIPRLKGSAGNKILSILFVLIASISYASLLYPFKYKPYFLNNSFPALFLVLVVVTIHYFIQGKETTDSIDNRQVGGLVK